MSDQTTDAEIVKTTGTDAEAADLVLEYELEAPPEKVWRAITIPAFRERWLPGRDLAEAEPVVEVPGKEISYRMRDTAPPFLESVVAFQLRPDSNGGTVIRIVHDLADGRLAPRMPKAANNNEPVLMLAA
ncbi:SRPBCC family protein [Roseibium salinum]|uniref:SRPBCC domain-containing protein n=1 Tax=Roseibium salinum TaxID=1604349 RepID=A0ABT3QVD4_9HYPH|nr:SRPBCC domain-containing protein [Roseibium sp. DSM 29163]MCX2720885.1 SRPBCC domain-containing protein [Roseibium sp. DSM 29163]MDN3722309.1 SRPBCC domain-containing protein [Roseibium salinum]